MKANIIIKGDSVGAIFARITKAVNEESKVLSSLLAREQRKNISKRTQKGIGIDDNRMKALSEAYRKQKRKLGRFGIRDLRLSGDMIHGMKATPSKKSGGAYVSEIGFNSGEIEKIARYNQDREPWFGISEQDKGKLLEKAKEKFFPGLLARLKK